jgi:hypothetical protein
MQFQRVKFMFTWLCFWAHGETEHRGNWHVQNRARVHLTVDRKQRERKIFWGSGITFKVRPQ